MLKRSDRSDCILRSKMLRRRRRGIWYNTHMKTKIITVALSALASVAAFAADYPIRPAEMTNVAITRTRKVGRYHLMDAQNPVYIAVVRGR